MQIFIKYFHSSCNSFFGTFILAFPFHSNAVLLIRENTVCFIYIFLDWKKKKKKKKKNISTITTFHDWKLKFLLLSYFFKFLSPTFSLEGTWKPEERSPILLLIILQASTVCVEVLRPRQPNGVMSSAVSLPTPLLLDRFSALSG